MHTSLNLLKKRTFEIILQKKNIKIKAFAVENQFKQGVGLFDRTEGTSMEMVKSAVINKNPLRLLEGV